MIKIKKLKEEYLDDVLNLMIRMYDSEAVDHKVDERILKNSLVCALKSNPYLFGYVISDNTDVIGFGLISKSFSTEVGAKIVIFEDLYIKEGYRSMGTGKKYFNYIFSRHKAKRYRLEVTKSNVRAINLYKKLGFEKLNYIQMIKDV